MSARKPGETDKDPLLGNPFNEEYEVTSSSSGGSTARRVLEPWSPFDDIGEVSSGSHPAPTRGKIKSSVEEVTDEEVAEFESEQAEHEAEKERRKKEREDKERRDRAASVLAPPLLSSSSLFPPASPVSSAAPKSMSLPVVAAPAPAAQVQLKLVNARFTTDTFKQLCCFFEGEFGNKFLHTLPQDGNAPTTHKFEFPKIRGSLLVDTSSGTLTATHDNDEMLHQLLLAAVTAASEAINPVFEISASEATKRKLVKMFKEAGLRIGAPTPEKSGPSSSTPSA